MPRIALSEQERQQRRQHLLATARTIYRETRTLPTVADIAARAGVAKGSVYSSFTTKEEIFVALLADSFATLLAGLAHDIEAWPVPAEPVVELPRALVRQVLQQPDLLPLAAMTHAVLEKNLPEEAMASFKHGLADGLRLLGVQLSGKVGVDAAIATTCLMRSWALTLGLWQALDCPAALLDVLQQPGLEVFRGDFALELEAAQREYWLGALPPQA
ncbi:TetR family transcriptional regulator [Paludibacterium yongneupense]|uniref:TetR family transcriptional regulator n=1 Tax=Paludibacterium yongneupense TaxID=400061 RepID=UPI0003F923B6|nr:TetR family transcriptional regulator [Paludibacterium yongneupense]